MALQVSFGNGGTPTQWHLPGTDIAALPPGPPDGTAPVDDAITDGPNTPDEGISSLFGGAVAALSIGSFAYFDVVGGWNSVKNAFAVSDTAADVWFNGFVQVDVALGGSGDSSVIINGAKRGNIVTGAGNDTVFIAHLSNETTWNNEFRVATGAGADSLFVTDFDAAAEAAGGDATYASFAGTGGVWNGSGSFTTVIATLGEGDDFFFALASGAAVIVDAGAGDDWLSGGRGEATFTGGKGSDIFVVGSNEATATITDFSGIGSQRLVTIDFEEVTGIPTPFEVGLFAPIPDGYDGLDWTNAGIIDTAIHTLNPTGYQAGVVSGTNVGYNRAGQPATVAMPDDVGSGRFDLVSGWFTGAWRDGVTVTITAVGDTGAGAPASTSFTVSSDEPLFVTFGEGFTGITSFTIMTEGGTENPAYPAGNGPHVAIDDLVLRLPDPDTDGDRIWLSGIAGEDIAQVLADAVQDGDDTLLAWGENNTVRLAGVDATSLRLEDFIDPSGFAVPF